MVKIAIPNFCINFLNKTEKSLPILCDFAVTSLADVWIKIVELISEKIISSLGRTLLWVRGLKLAQNRGQQFQILVASLTGAWIKTNRLYLRLTIFGSHPSWMRGLK